MSDNSINTVAILGAGAVGAYFIWGLYERLGDSLWVVADGERRERLERDGVPINGKVYRPAIKTPEEARGADLLLVSVKYTALHSALDDIQRIVCENTTVMSLLNGVSSEEIIAERIGDEHMLYSMMKISSEHRDGAVRFDPDTTPGLFYGEKDSRKPSPRMLAIGKLLDETPIHHHMCDDIITQMWDKFALNVSNNLPQAIINCGIGAYADSKYAHHVFAELRREVAAVAAAKGITISPEPDDMLQRGITRYSARYSTLQDIDAKRHTEVDMFAGSMVEMGRETGVPTPYCECVYDLIKAIEEKNDGKFDY